MIVTINKDAFCYLFSSILVFLQIIKFYHRNYLHLNKIFLILLTRCFIIIKKAKINKLPVEDAVNFMISEDYGIHSMVLYPDLYILRQFYSSYTKSQIRDEKEIILISSIHENTNSVRNTLSIGDDAIDVSKYEKDNSLVIVDPLKLYSSKEATLNFRKRLLNYSKERGKNGVALFGDMGIFNYKVNGGSILINYEMSLPIRFSEREKGFCLYYKHDFESLPKMQRQKLIGHHGITIELMYK